MNEFSFCGQTRKNCLVFLKKCFTISPAKCTGAASANTQDVNVIRINGTEWLYEESGRLTARMQSDYQEGKGFTRRPRMGDTVVKKAKVCLIGITSGLNVC